MKKWLKYLKIAFWSVFISVTLLIGSSVFIAYTYEDDIIAYALNEFQKQLNTDVHIEDVDLTLLQSFPDASLVFTNISAKEAGGGSNKKELFHFEHLSLSFNVRDLFHKKYDIRHITLENGALHIKLFKNGSDNYHFWNSGSDTSETKFAFNLQKVQLRQVAFLYQDFQHNTRLDTYLHHLSLKGKFNESRFDLATYGNIDFKEAKLNGEPYLRQEQVHFDLLLDVKEMKEYFFKRGKLQIASQDLEVLGTIEEQKTGTLFNIQIQGDHLKPEKIVRYLPKEYQNYWDEYRLNGSLFFDAQINGLYSKQSSPLIIAEFGIKDGKIKRKGTSQTIDQLYLKGGFTNGASKNKYSSSVSIDSMSFTFGKSHIQLNGKMHNLARPQLRLKAKSHLVLEEIQEFFPIDTIEDMKGRADINIQFASRLEAIDIFRPKDFINSSCLGEMKIQDGFIRLKNDPYPIEAITGNIRFTNNDLILNQLLFQKGSSDFTFEGKALNFLSFLFFEEQKLYVQATVSSQKLNLNELLAEEKASEENASYEFSISDKLDFDLQYSADHFHFRRFHADQLRSHILIKNKLCIAEDIRLNSMQGKVLCKGTLNAKDPNNIQLQCEADLKEVDVKECFYQFENFGQKSLISNHLKGKLNTNVQFSSVLTNQLDVKLDKTQAIADLSIQNGELINYAPMQELSSFVALEELKHIRFSELKNTIQVKDNKIIIPKMDIQSNAMNLGISGEHTFNNEIDYRIELLMSEVLSKKARKAKKENSEFGIIEDDGMGKSKLFIKVFGTVDEPEFAYDRKGLQQKIKNDLKEEKQTLKHILNEEFGWFKKDTSVNKAQVEETENTSFDKHHNDAHEEAEETEEEDEEIQDGIEIEW